MITGVVNADLEATIPLDIQDAGGQTHQVEAVIDTGFNGFLTLPSALVASLGLPWLCRQQGLLADGSVQVFDVYTTKVNWDGSWRTVEVEAVESKPLVGTALLQGYTLQVKVVSGGSVTIQALP